VDRLPDQPSRRKLERWKKGFSCACQKQRSIYLNRETPRKKISAHRWAKLKIFREPPTRRRHLRRKKRCVGRRSEMSRCGKFREKWKALSWKSARARPGRKVWMITKSDSREGPVISKKKRSVGQDDIGPRDKKARRLCYKQGAQKVREGRTHLEGQPFGE